MPRATPLAGGALAAPLDCASASWGECADPTLNRRTPSTTGGGFAAAVSSWLSPKLNARAVPSPPDIATATAPAAADASTFPTAMKPIRRLRAARFTALLVAGNGGQAQP